MSARGATTACEGVPELVASLLADTSSPGAA
jgi:hypothetical protein